MTLRRRLTAAALAAAALAAGAQPAWAVSDKDLKDGLEKAGASGSGTPHVSLAFGGSLGRSVLGVVVVVLAILVVAKLLKANQKRRGTGRGAGDLIEVIGTTPLGPNRNLHLVRVGDEVLLIGAGEGGISPLRAFQPGEARAIGALPAEQPSFAAALAEAGVPASPPVVSGELLPAAPRREPARRGMLSTLRELSAR